MSIRSEVVPFKLIGLLRYSLRAKFGMPARGDVLIFDGEGSKALIRGLKMRNITFTVLHVRGETFNLLAALAAIPRALVTKSSLFEAYVDKFIHFSRAKVAVTTIDNDVRFWKLGVRNSRLITIAIQNGVRGKRFDVFEGLPVPASWTGTLFCFNEAIAAEYSRLGNFGEIVPIGSFRSNEITVEAAKREGVAWISQYSPDWNSNEVSSEEFHESERTAFVLFSDWAQSKGLVPSVLLRSDLGMLNGEAAWFRSAWPDGKLHFVERDLTLGHYIRIDSMELLATCDSTLGYEALARGAKVFFCNWRPLELGAQEFGWPAKLSEKGPFWTNSQRDGGVASALNVIFTLSNEEFRESNAKTIELVMRSNLANATFWNLVSSSVSQAKYESFLEDR